MRGTIVALFYGLKQSFPGLNRRFLHRFVLVLFTLFILYSCLFQFFMWLEGRDYTFIAGSYWTLVVMSTLGFGDIVFASDAGLLFTMLVNITGVVLMIVMLPFVIIEFVYNPLMKLQKDASAPRQLPATLKGHVLITQYDAVAEALIARLVQHNISYAVVIEDITEAYRLSDLGIRVLVGSTTQPLTYRQAQVQNAALVTVASSSDPVNVNIVFSVRQVCDTVPIVALTNLFDSVDILTLAGSTQVIDISDLMGRALSRTSSTDTGAAHILGSIDELRIIEARTAGTKLAGKTLKQADLGRNFNITVVGVWTRGNFELAGPHTRITESSILVMAASEQQLAAYNAEFSIPGRDLSGVVIIGAGRVGTATARYLSDMKIPFVLIDKDENARLGKKCFPKNLIIGDASDLHFLKSTSFFDASAIIVTTHDDDINVFLTLYFRKLRSEVQILARANHEKNVTTLHRAGADFVYSTSTMASTVLFNHLNQGRLYTMVEGLFAKQVKAPKKMVGKSLINLQFRALTGCSVIGMIVDDHCIINPSPFDPIPEGAEIIMVLTPETEARFLQCFGGS